MKRYLALPLGVFLSILFLLPAGGWAQGGRFAYVNFQDFAKKSKRFAAAQKKLRRQVARKQAELKRKQDQLIAKNEDLKKQSPMIKPERRDAMIKEIGIIEMELKLAKKRAQQWLQNEQREQMELMRRDIRKIIEGIRKKRKLSLVFDAMGLLGADPALDITDEVVAMYDAQAPAAVKRPRRPSRAPAARKPARAPARKQNNRR